MIPVKKIMPLLGLLLIFGLAGCKEETASQNEPAAAESTAETKLELQTDIQRASYALGYRQTEGLVKETQNLLDQEAFLQGVTDYLSKSDSLVADSELPAAIQALQVAIRAKQAEASAALAAAGTEYRNEFAAKEGVTSLPSGLLYEVITEGSGEKPGPTDQVETHYHGTLIDGTVFDSSVERGTPATFGVNQVIKGWTEALQLMPVGSKWRLVVPPELAYGSQARATIPANSTLIFEVELLSIK
jgi:FKBP-type peptidyl-prolyl cis-trans isomerase